MLRWRTKGVFCETRSCCGMARLCGARFLFREGKATFPKVLFSQPLSCSALAIPFAARPFAPGLEVVKSAFECPFGLCLVAIGQSQALQMMLGPVCYIGLVFVNGGLDCVKRTLATSQEPVRFGKVLDEDAGLHCVGAVFVHQAFEQGCEGRWIFVREDMFVCGSSVLQRVKSWCLRWCWHSPGPREDFEPEVGAGAVYGFVTC